MAGGADRRPRPAAGPAPAGARRHGYGPLPVDFLGKAATFNLLYAFPLLLIAAHDWAVSDVARPVAWAFVIWGTALYLFSAGLYLTHVVQLVRADRRAA